MTRTRVANTSGMKAYLIPCVVTLMGLMGCASQQGRFEQIIPNMTYEDVKRSMKDGPTRFDQPQGSEYAAWFWGDNDYCVLFKNGRVVAKDARGTGSSGSIAGAEYEETTSAQCLAPGQLASNQKGRTVRIPGIGTVELPEDRK